MFSGKNGNLTLLTPLRIDAIIRTVIEKPTFTDLFTKKESLNSQLSDSFASIPPFDKQ